VLLTAGLLVLTGMDKRIEAAALDHFPAWLTALTTRY
jgi:cytochrome c-type biogenesis protein